MTTKKLGPMARYGSRYGYRLKKKAKNVEVVQKAKHECPKCGKKSMKRRSNGVWACTKCGAVMAGGAYSPHTGAWKGILSILGGKRVEMHEMRERS